MLIEDQRGASLMFKSSQVFSFFHNGRYGLFLIYLIKGIVNAQKLSVNS